MVVSCVHSKEQVRKRVLPRSSNPSNSGGKPLFLTCSLTSFKFLQSVVEWVSGRYAAAFV